MLSPAEISHYHEHGYVIPDFRFDEDTLDEVRAAHQRLLHRHPQFDNYCPSLLAYDLSYLNVARNEALLDMTEQLIGPDFALWNASFFAKPGGGGHATPWHQDGEYWPIRPIATCTAWIAIDPATQDNGCLRVIRGSHKAQRLLPHNTNPSDRLTLNQELAADQFDAAEAVDLVLEAGQISLHDVYLIHGSEANHSPHSRRGMTLRFMPTSSHFDRALAAEQYTRFAKADHSHRTLFLMRGADRSGKNDFRLRR